MRKRVFLLLPLLFGDGCLMSRMSSQGIDTSRFDPAQRLNPVAVEQNFTMRNDAIHEDPELLKVGVSRDRIAAAFGAPNETQNRNGQIEDTYEFNPDGSKFVAPKTYARNVAAGVFTGGAAMLVRQGRIAHTEHQLTVYRLTYGRDRAVQAVHKEAFDSPSDESSGANGH
jgi:hypothetical protein